MSFGDVETEADGVLAFTAEIEYRGKTDEDLWGYGFPGGYIKARGKPKTAVSPYFTAVQRWRILGDGTATARRHAAARFALSASGANCRALAIIGLFRSTLPRSSGSVAARSRTTGTG